MTDTPTGMVVEIRVHGVSNTPPHSMLLSRRPEDVELVAGDETTGFYRRTDLIPAANPQVLTLAYSWGQLTAGVRARKDLYRALWMLLLPFALVNVAFWARTRLPGVDRDDGLSRTGGLASWLARLLALSLTVTLVLAAAGVGVDMVAWQWPLAAREQPEEVRTLPWLEFLTSDWWASGSRGLAVGLVAPAAALALLYGVARRTFAYEAEVPATATRPRARTGMPLTSPAFWRGERQVRNLAAIHLLVGATAACAVAAGPAIAADYGTGDWGRAAAWVLGVVLVVEALAALLLLAAPAVTDRGEPSTSAVAGHPRRSARSAGQRLVTAMPWAALATFAVTAAYLLLPRDELATATELPGFDGTVRAMFIGQVLTLSALAAATRWSRVAAWTWTLLLAVLLSAAVLVVTAGPTRIDAHVSVFALTAVALVLIPAASWLLPKTVPTSLTASVEGREVTVDGVAGHSMLDQPAWRGTGTALLSGVGLLLGGLYAAGALFYVGRWLSTPSEGRPRLINPPDALGWAAVGLPIFVLVAAGFAIGAVVWLHRRASQLSSGIPAEYKRAKSVHAHVRARDVAKARALHEFVSERLLARIGWLGGLAIVGVALTCAGAATGLAPDENVSPDWLGQSLAAMRDFGTRLALLLAGAIVLAGALVYRGRPERRGVGIVWDLATFWPRAGHPFAPPSYAERCVPQLMTRVGAGDASGYILAGHSQGAVLSLATVLQVPRELRAKLYLLTFGTQLHRLYGRVFPAVFGPVQLHQAATMLRVDADGQLQPWLRWQSLHRASDPLGYPVNVRLDAVGPGAAAVDGDVVPDPTDLVPSGGEILDPPLRKHSDYPAEVRYTALRDEAAARLCPTPPDSPDGCHADPEPR